MTKEYVKKSHIASWPENDVYFSTGISALARKVTNSHSGPDYLFINLNSYTLKLFFRSFSQLSKSGYQLIIISTQRLMPLAFFWHLKCHAVSAIFDRSCSVHDVIRGLDTVATGRQIVWSFPGPAVYSLQETFYFCGIILKGEVWAIYKRNTAARIPPYRDGRLQSRGNLKYENSNISLFRINNHSPV